MKKFFQRLMRKKKSASTDQLEPNLLLLTLDNKVCSQHLLSFLRVNDLLRLRRVCHSSKKSVEEFIQTQRVKTEREFKFMIVDQIGDEYSEKCQRSSNTLPLPTRVVVSQFRNLYKSLLLRPALRNFMENCGPTITHLSLDYFQVPLDSRRLVNFFETFPNVNHLVFKTLGHEVDDEDKERLANRNELAILHDIIIPTSLNNLKTLRINESSRKETPFLFAVELVWACHPNLEILSLPFAGWMLGGARMEDQVTHFACEILFSAHNVKLDQLDGELLEILLRTEDRIPEMGTLHEMVNIINAKVMSIRNPQTTECLENIYDLEEINFKCTDGCEFTNLKEVRTNWPSLKKISVCFDDMMKVPEFVELWEFLFGGRLRRGNEIHFEGGVKRDGVTMLDITFDGNRECVRSENFIPCYETIHKTTDIMMCCENLKILHLEYYSCHQIISLSFLWENLPQLEELLFRRFKYLDDDDFVGDDAKNPAFCNLKKLRALELTEMDNYHVTNCLFSQVLKHMPLTKLTLSSKYNAHRITLQGIRSLLNGKFATTVERLSLDNLQLKGVTKEMKKQVERQFRSSQMV